MAHFLVIAASSGIGQATVSLLKEAGHSLFTTARDQLKIFPDTIVDATDFDGLDSVFKHVGSFKLWRKPVSGRSSKYEKRAKLLQQEAE
jgi:NADPH:quinone reductase-like Zn-dependent oxidoreductase